MELNANWLARLAEYHPDRPAVLWRGHWVSYGELYQRARRAAASLAGLGIQKGDRVGVLSLNHLGYLELYFAAPLLGFVPTLLNHRLSEAELRGLLEYTRPRALFYGPDFADLARQLDPGAWPLEALQTLSPAPLSPYQAAPDDPALILFTGGTTGLPKGALIPYRQLLVNAFQTCLSWGLQKDDAYIVSTPMFHAALNALATPLLYLGGRVIIQEKFDPAEYLHWVSEHQVSLLFLVPTMFQMLALHPDFATANLQSVRWAISGGAPCPAPVREAFRAKLVRFKQGYGLTECGVNCFTLELDEAEQFPESVGRPMPHLWARLVDASGQENPHRGELWLSGPVVMLGYFHRPTDTAEALIEHEGRIWLRTGDLAERDEQGRYFIVGRAKEMFISGGENVYPIEIERALYDHPAVLECAVVGVPDARWGEVGLAAIVLKSPLSEEELRAYLKTRLAGYKVPKHFLFTSELPKSGPGKILKSALAARFKGEHA
ncbi:MAG: long-chain-fatty-acid--CoA ligase [Meiothermus sp.]|uniref:Long-chain-fatty-acid--CoA ligase n=2 Tax=Meiothermus hypogaeus TaxID=884155 RepID=A0A511R1P7_9DEIN|nr:AMP-binding protein [Meiothermus hypogaeus]RIH80165.1 Long-chain-fatty-acid--CoA ligase [Meiothermus hypogaeus]GEM83538.1 long-chain-fatty-acid--CoA ligase [Meiothermus hypogaeus NBRC 106114]GIW37667.1 MAG: long-chain-fatty-acid--CoA ligase [Meiothermus sp.]